jgi:hypothetical protein
VRFGVLWGACLAAAFLLATPALAQSRARAEGLAAIVGGLAPGPGVELVLRSDVELRARLRLAGQAPESPLPLGALPEALVRATLDELIGELLIAREAARIRIRPPTLADVLRERASLEAEAGGAERLAELLRALGAPPSELEAMAHRRAVVGAFLTANLEGTTEISDAEVERLYLAGEHPFADLELDEAREPLRVWAAQAALERAVARWVSVLRARTPLRIVLRER